jgi:hypothetical protein
MVVSASRSCSADSRFFASSACFLFPVPTCKQTPGVTEAHNFSEYRSASRGRHAHAASRGRHAHRIRKQDHSIFATQACLVQYGADDKGIQNARLRVDHRVARIWTLFVTNVPGAVRGAPPVLGLFGTSLGFECLLHAVAREAARLLRELFNLAQQRLPVLTQHLMLHLQACLARLLHTTTWSYSRASSVPSQKSVQISLGMPTTTCSCVAMPTTCSCVAMPTTCSCVAMPTTCSCVDLATSVKGALHGNKRKNLPYAVGVKEFSILSKCLAPLGSRCTMHQVPSTRTGPYLEGIVLSYGHALHQQLIQGSCLLLHRTHARHQAVAHGLPLSRPKYAGSTYLNTPPCATLNIESVPKSFIARILYRTLEHLQ